MSLVTVHSSLLDYLFSGAKPQAPLGIASLATDTTSRSPPTAATEENPTPAATEIKWGGVQPRMCDLQNYFVILHALSPGGIRAAKFTQEILDL